MAFACCLSEEEKEAIRRSQQIDRQLQQEEMSLRKDVKILLLGASESGKSTFMKQMRIIHGEDYSPCDRLEFRNIIYHNVLKGMKILVEARKRLAISLEDPRNEENGELVTRYRREHEFGDLIPEKFSTYVEALQSLWRDSGIQATLRRSNEFQLGDSVPYFIKKIDVIGSSDYIPSEEDILHSRKATQGVHEYTININSKLFRFIDIGGQRSLRKKWFHCFDNVTSILFLVSSSAFDQTLWEDWVTNRLVESMNVFDTIVNNRFFRSATIILLFNKTDLLIEKIKWQNIRKFFPDFSGDPTELADVQHFMVRMFNSVRRDKSQELYKHFTTAVNTKNIRVVFNIVIDSIIHHRVQEIMQL